MVLNTRKRLQFMIIIVNSDLIERRDVIFICSNDSWSAADVCRMQQLVKAMKQNASKKTVNVTPWKALSVAVSSKPPPMHIFTKKCNSITPRGCFYLLITDAKICLEKLSALCIGEQKVVRTLLVNFDGA